MKKDLTEVVFILDKSGSMSGLEKDTIGGFNSLIEKQKKEAGEAIVSTVLFSDHSKVIHNRIDIKEIPLLTAKEYYVSGCTALLDAVGNAINFINKKHNESKEDEVPEKTLFIITTDGQENASREFTYDKVKNIMRRTLLIDGTRRENDAEHSWHLAIMAMLLTEYAEDKNFSLERSDLVA